MSDIDLEFGNNPTLEGLIKFAINSMLTDVHTVIPGHILDYDATTGFATVQVDIMQKHIGTWNKIPPIAGVPVMMPRAYGGSAFLSLPLKEGDPGLILFSERSIDAWSSSGGTVNPKDVRKHDLSDAIFYPGLYPANSPVNPTNSTDVVLQNDTMVLKLGNDGKTYLGNGKITIAPSIAPVPNPTYTPLPVNVDLLEILSKLIESLMNGTMIPGAIPGAWTFDPVALTNLQTIYDTLQKMRI